MHELRSGGEEDRIIGELGEVAPAPVHAVPHEVGIEQRQPDREQGGSGDEHRHAEQERRQQQPRLGGGSGAEAVLHEAYRTVRPLAASNRNQRSSGARTVRRSPWRNPSSAENRPTRRWTPAEQVDEHGVARSFDELDVRRHGIDVAVAGQHEVLRPDAALHVAVRRHRQRQRERSDLERARRSRGGQDVHPRLPDERRDEPVGRTPVDVVGCAGLLEIAVVDQGDAVADRRAPRTGRG